MPSDAASADGARGAGRTPRRRRVPFVLFGIVVAGFLLRLFGVGDRSFWLDEVLTYEDALKPLGRLVSGEHSPVHPPLLYVLSHALVLIGRSEAILRSQAVVFGTLAIPALYFAARSLAGRRAGLVAAALLAVSPFHVRYSQEARHYALLTFFAVAALAGLARSIRAILDEKRRPPVSACVAFVLGGTLALYSHYGALPVLFAYGLVLLALVAREAFAGRRREAWRLFAFGAFGFLAMLALFSPMAENVAQFADATLAENPTAPSGRPQRDALVPLLAQPEFVLEYFSAVSGGIPLLFALPLVLGAASLLGSSARRRRSLLVLSLTALVPIAVFLAIPSTHPVSERYLLPSLPGFLVLAAVGIARSGAVLAARLATRRKSAARAAATAGITLLAAASFSPALARHYAEDSYPWRECLERIAREGKPGDGVVVFPEFLRVSLGFYAPAARPVQPLYTAEDILRLDRNGAEDVSLFVVSSHINKESRTRRLEEFLSYFRKGWTEAGTTTSGKIAVTRLRRALRPRPN